MAKKPIGTVKKTETQKRSSVKKAERKASAPAKAKKIEKTGKTKAVSKAVKPKTATASPKPLDERLGRDEVLKRQLIRHREAIVKEAKDEIGKYIKGETRQLVESVLDDGDWSVIDLSEDINLRRLAAHREVLLKIDEALRKLREGTYGTCEDCGEVINTARLKVLPFAIYCRDCQEKKEEMERVESEGS